MPKNKVSDPITDQEIAFARLVLFGAMTDRRAAEAVGLNPDSAAYTKSKPRVRAYMLEHRAAVQQQLVQQDADGQRRLNLDREKVLNRLWEIANLPAEVTRGSITGQVKAISMIVAMQNLIPDRRATSPERNSVPASMHPEIHAAACPPRPSRRAVEPAVRPAGQQPTTVDPQASPAPVQQEDEPGIPEPKLDPSPVAGPPPHPGPSQSTFANRSTPSQAQAPYVPLFTSIPDLGVPFSRNLNPFAHPR